jgi:hypothetical protein
MNASELVIFFLKVQNQFQILHWQTTSYAKHNAYGGIYDAIGGLVDRFVEVYQGKYGRIKVGGAQVQVVDITDESLNGFIAECIAVLSDDVPGVLESSHQEHNDQDTDLLNIRDEMLSEFNKLRYLLTLK